MRIGVLAIVVKGDRKVASVIQEILTDFSDIIVGRMGVPDHSNNISVISVMLKGSVEKISALSGKIGALPSVSVKSALVSESIGEVK